MRFSVMLKMLILSASVLLILSGCGSEQNENGSEALPQPAENGASQAEDSAAEADSEEEHSEPVTLTLFPWNPFPQHEVEMFIQQHLEKKYPHITVELLDMPRNDLQNLIVSGNPPDLIAAAASFLSQFADMDLLEDITPYVKKHNLDLSRFDQRYFEYDWLYNDPSLYGLPYSVPFGALYYNMDIFDRFGVEYPPDGMTWDEVIDLARQLTRTDEGIDFKGFVVDINRVLLPLGQAYIDPETHEATVSSNPLFRDAYSIYQRIVSIPGNEQSGGRVAIFLRGEAAMMAHIQQFNDNFKKATEEGLRWNVAQYPSFEEPKNTYLDYNPHIMIPTKVSKNKDAAIQVLDVLTSVEAQMDVSRQGHLTSLSDPAVLEVFGENLSYLEGIDVQRIFKSHPSTPITRTEYNAMVQSIIFNEAAAMLESGTDVNTVVREINERINLKIAEAKNQ